MWEVNDAVYAMNKKSLYFYLCGVSFYSMRDLSEESIVPTDNTFLKSGKKS